jgi:hypothetical protein
VNGFGQKFRVLFIFLLMSQRGFHFHTITNEQLMTTGNEIPMLAEFSNFVSYHLAAYHFRKKELSVILSQNILKVCKKDL